MASHGKPSHPLRSITQRLSSTPSNQLPNITKYLVNDLFHCKEALSSPQPASTKEKSDVHVLVHKFKSQLSSLLLEKTCEARWSAIVLVKASIEAGGWEVLQTSGPWVRNMLLIMTKNDPSVTKNLCILTLTRVFLLTQGHQGLIREMTTPSLPGFISSGLALVSGKGSKGVRAVRVEEDLLPAVLQSFITLLPHHPTIFRPFLTQIRVLISPMIAPTPSNLLTSKMDEVGMVSSAASHLAHTLYAILPRCAPRNGSSDEWSRQLLLLIDHIHRTASHLFRAILEDYIPAEAMISSKTRSMPIPGDTVEDEMHLPGWQGIHAGSERLCGLMKLLQACISTESIGTLRMPVRAILSTLERLLAVFAPMEDASGVLYNQVRANPEFERDEREDLWSALSPIHESALETMSTFLKRMGYNGITVAKLCFERLIWLFGRVRKPESMKALVYRILTQLTDLIGPSLSRHEGSTMTSVLHAACEDCLSSSRHNDPSLDTSLRRSRTSSLPNGDNYLKQTTSTQIADTLLNEIAPFAAHLLQVVISRVSADALPAATRSMIDQSGIFSQREDTMLASVLNPPTKRVKGKPISSILPFLARAYPNSLGVEALVRPRMPVIQSNHTDQFVDDEDAEDIALAGKSPLPARYDWTRGSDVKGMAESTKQQTAEKAALPLNQRSIEPTTTGIQESTISPRPTKRARSTETLNRDAGGGEGEQGRDLSTEDTAPSKEPVIKRTRVEVDAANEDNARSGSLEGGSKSRATSADLLVTVHESGRDVIDEDDSDGSFEIPRIVLDSESEVEDEEEGGEMGE